MRKELGKIISVRCGLGGYQDAQIGIGFTLGGDGWGVGTGFKGAWATKHSDSCKWTEQDRIESLGHAFMYLRELLKDAKVNDVTELVGIPVEVTFDGNQLLEWRILKEVL